MEVQPSSFTLLKHTREGQKFLFVFRHIDKQVYPFIRDLKVVAAAK